MNRVSCLVNWDFANRKGFGEILSPNINREVCGEKNISRALAG